MNELRFCNNCGCIIIGERCTKCFGMDLTSPRSRLLNRELFSPAHLKNSIPNRELSFERKNAGPLAPNELDLSKKLSENRLNAIKKEVNLPKVVENLSSSPSLKGNTAENILDNLDPIQKERNEWIESIKNDVNILEATKPKNIILEDDKLPSIKEISEAAHEVGASLGVKKGIPPSQ